MGSQDMRKLMESVDVETQPSLKDKIINALTEAYTKKDKKLWINLIDLINESAGCHGGGCHGRLDKDELIEEDDEELENSPKPKKPAIDKKKKAVACHQTKSSRMGWSGGCH